MGPIIIIHNSQPDVPWPTSLAAKQIIRGPEGPQWRGFGQKPMRINLISLQPYLLGFAQSPGGAGLNEMYLELNVFPFVYQSSRLWPRLLWWGSDIRRPNTIEKLSTSRLILD